MFHPTSVISPKAEISSNVKIGPFCVVEEDVIIGKDCELISHVHITGKTKNSISDINVTKFLRSLIKFILPNYLLIRHLNLHNSTNLKEGFLYNVSTTCSCNNYSSFFLKTLDNLDDFLLRCFYISYFSRTKVLQIIPYHFCRPC